MYWWTLTSKYYGNFLSFYSYHRRLIIHQRDTMQEENKQKKKKTNILRLISFTNFNAQFFYSLTICMLHYNPRHVSSINMPIFRRTNCIITASGVVTLCKRPYSMPDESRALILRVMSEFMDS